MSRYTQVLIDLVNQRDDIQTAIDAISRLDPEALATVVRASGRTAEQIKSERLAQTEQAIQEVREEVKRQTPAFGDDPKPSARGRLCDACGQRSGGPRSKTCQHCFEPFK